MRRRFKHVAAIALGLVACSTSVREGGSSEVAFTISGEDAALEGFSFPAAGDEVAMVDGWELRFDRVLVTVGDIVLTEDPDASPTDQSITGPVVARAVGPWAVDLAKAGVAVSPPLTVAANGLKVAHENAADLTPVTGRGSSSDRAIRLVRIAGQNVSDGQAFDPEVRYGVGYDVLAATSRAERVNLDADGQRDYDDMIARGWSLLYVGTATFRGDACMSPHPDDFASVPNEVRFRLGFATPAQYINCQNSDLSGKPFDGEEKQRGLQLKDKAVTYAQLTLHLEHPFFDTTAHDQAKPLFDQIAAAATSGVVTMDALRDLDPTGFRLRSGQPLPWRSCISEIAPKKGQRRFDTGSIAVSRAGRPEATLRNYADYMGYAGSTMGHLNADGLCAVRRKYPSPP